MKKSMRLLLIAALVLTSFTACGGSLKVDENTVYVQKKGKITGATVESFDKDYYDAEELKAYVEERVAAYTASHDDKSVQMDGFSVEEGTARLNIKYADYKDYAEFNGVEMFVGTLPMAMVAGYDFDCTFLQAVDGELTSEASKDDVIANDEYKVVILSEKVNVKVDGTILYTSADYTSLTAKDTVAIKLPEDAQDGEELKLTYIIYK